MAYPIACRKILDNCLARVAYQNLYGTSRGRKPVERVNLQPMLWQAVTRAYRLWRAEKMHMARLGRVCVFRRVFEWRRKHRARSRFDIEVAQVLSVRQSWYVRHGGVKGNETTCGATIIKGDVLQGPCDEYGVRGGTLTNKKTTATINRET